MSNTTTAFHLTEVCPWRLRNAPMVPINDEIIDLTADSMAPARCLARGEPQDGPQIERQTSAPEGGPSTLKKMAERNYDYRGQW